MVVVSKHIDSYRATLLIHIAETKKNHPDTCQINTMETGLFSSLGRSFGVVAEI
jgi:hypothetical protein